MPLRKIVWKTKLKKWANQLFFIKDREYNEAIRLETCTFHSTSYRIKLQEFVVPL